MKLKSWSIIVMILIAATLLLLSTPPPSTTSVPVKIGLEDLHKRQAKAAQHTYRPGYGLGIGRRGTGWTMGVLFDSASWYHPEELLGNQWQDLNKVGGVSFFNWWQPSTWPLNHCAALAAWRCDTVPYQFMVAAYTNDCDGGHNIGSYLRVAADEFVLIDYDYFNGVAVYELWGDTSYQQDVLPIEPQRAQINAGAWHGGNLPAPQKHHLYSALRHK